MSKVVDDVLKTRMIRLKGVGLKEEILISGIKDILELYFPKWQPKVWLDLFEWKAAALEFIYDQIKRQPDKIPAVEQVILKMGVSLKDVPL